MLKGNREEKSLYDGEGRVSGFRQDAGLDPTDDPAAADVLAAFKTAKRAGLNTAECYCAGVEAWRRSHPDQTQTYSAKQAVAVIQAIRIRLLIDDA